MQLGKLTSEFESRLAAKDNEINALKGENGAEDGNTPSSSIPKGLAPSTPEKMAARNKQLDLCDVFRRIKNTADDKLVELIAHKWQPATASQWV